MKQDIKKLLGLQNIWIVSSPNLTKPLLLKIKRAFYKNTLLRILLRNNLSLLYIPYYH